MVTCPRGHQSQATDYCDECGTPIGATPTPKPTATPAATAAASPAPSTAAGPPCPDCGTPSSGRFCEVCGHDFIMAKLGGGSSAPKPATPDLTAVAAPEPDPDPPVSSLATRTPAPTVAAQWRLTAASDAAYHARMETQREPDAEAIPLPAFCPERRFTLTGTQALIGRRSKSRGIEPEIDLSGPPADPAVSHAHALLLTGPDGTWAIVDLESANGTYVNDSPEAIEPNMPVPLQAGDRVHVGAWTTLTLQPLT